jgi:hypothetical protein
LKERCHCLDGFPAILKSRYRVIYVSLPTR